MTVHENFYDLKYSIADNFVQLYIKQLLAWIDCQVTPLTCIHTF